MYCSKCGAQNDDTSMFCSKCGSGMNGNAVKPVVETQQKKKKSKKMLFIIVAVIVVSIAAIVIANWGGGVDYAATVGAHKPFVSQGTSLTYATVLNEYIVSPVWEVRESGNTAFVDISGTVKGTDVKLAVRISVAANQNNSDAVTISPVSVTIDGEQSPTKDDAAEFLLAMFYAYEEGYKNIAELFSETETPDLENPIEPELPTSLDLSETYTNETEGFSFDYPGDWEIVSGNSESEIVTIRPFELWTASFIVYESFDVFDTLTADEATVKKNVESTDQKFISFTDVTIDGTPAKKLIISSSMVGVVERVFVRYYYSAGGRIYEICGFSEMSELEIYGPVFDAIIETYSIDPNTALENNDTNEAAANTYEDIIVLDFIAGSGWDIIIGWLDDGTEVRGYIGADNEYITTDSGDFILLKEDNIPIYEGDMFAITYTDDVYDDYPDGGIYKILTIESYYGNARADGFDG